MRIIRGCFSNLSNKPNSTVNIHRIDDEIGLINEYRRRLIADVITGKLDVREAARDFPDVADEAESEPEGEELVDEDSETTLEEADR